MTSGNPTSGTGPTKPPVRYPDPINQALIGSLAGVGRATVVNWRRHNPDFPGPVGGTTDSPMFDLAEVRAWLLKYKIIAERARPSETA